MSHLSPPTRLFVSTKGESMCLLKPDFFHTETALVGANKEEYFPMKPCAIVVPVDVTAGTTKRVLEVV
jgi:hypothetical protein